MPDKPETKELKDIITAIDKWHRKHKGDVVFYGGFVAFNGPECDVVEDRLFAYGSREVIKISMKELVKYINEKKEDFVNW